ncbi:MAG: hypothetical protein R3C68_03805 [Myxococcota bacterium]
MSQQGSSMLGSAKILLQRLFDGYELRDSLTADEGQRITQPHERLVGIVKGLTRRHAANGNASHMIQDARSFFRQGLAEKVRTAA